MDSQQYSYFNFHTLLNPISFQCKLKCPMMQIRRTGKSTIFGKLRQQARKRLSWPPVGRVDFGDLDRIRPISEDWGFHRGKPVDRYFIESFLSDNASDIRGRVLEVKDNEYTVRFGGDRVTRSDVIHKGDDNPAATIIDDLAEGHEIPSEAFDCIICTQTLNLIFDLPAAFRTLHRILRPGGVLLATVPAISRITLEPVGRYHDYWRFTTSSCRQLCEPLFGSANLRTVTYGNVYAAVAFLHGLSLEDLEVEKLGSADPNIELIVAMRATREGKE